MLSSNKKKLFDNITFICLTYNKQYFLRRSIEVFSKLEFNIIYCDGSDEPIDDINFKNFKNIKYLYKKTTYYERIKYLIPLIKTPYVCLIGDEEYYMPSAILKSINFLEKNENYEACSGHPLRFNFLIIRLFLEMFITILRR